jgi:hypothetical protein
MTYPSASRRLVLGLLLLAVVSVQARVPGQSPAPGAAADRLAEARRLLDEADYVRAAGELDQVIAELEASAIPTARVALPVALELRAAVRFTLNDREGAKRDFVALLTENVNYAATSTLSPRVAAFLDEVRQTTLARVRVVATPADAQVVLDGEQLSGIDRIIWVTPGPHRISATRAGHAPASQDIVGSPGLISEVELTLTRISASVTVATIPAGAAVFFRADAGVFEPKGPTTAAVSGVPGDIDVAAPVKGEITIADLKPGKYVAEFRLDCYKSRQFSLTIDELRDYGYAPVTLEPAVGSIDVASSAGTAAVYLDGQRRGVSPLAIRNVCAGPHTVELRSDVGRFVERINIAPGDSKTIAGTARPAFALLFGEPSDAATTEFFADVEGAVSHLRTVTAFVPPRDSLQPLLANGTTKALSELLAQTPRQRLDAVERLCKALEVQGVILVRKVTETPMVTRLDILASGSADPDSVDLSREDLAAGVAYLENSWEVVRFLPGFVAIDVLDGPPLIAEVDSEATAAGLIKGDRLVSVNDQPISNATEVSRIAQESRARGFITVQASDAAGKTKTAKVPLKPRVRTLAMNDRTVPFNILLAGFRAEAATTDPLGFPDAARLNAAISLMHLGNMAAAARELENTHLPTAPGVSMGTVNFLLGLSYKSLGRASDAARTLELAAQDPDSLLTEDGPSVKTLLSSQTLP